MARLISVSIPELQQRLRSYLNVRWVFLLLLSIAGLGTEFYSEGASHTLTLNAVGAAIALGLNGLFYAISRSNTNDLVTRILAMAVILSDTIISAFLVYSNGAIEARTTILFAIPLIAGGAFFVRRVIYFLAILSSLLYAAILWADYLRIIPSHIIYAPQLHSSFGDQLIATVFYPATFFMLALVSDYVIGLLNHQERELRQQAARLMTANNALADDQLKLQQANQKLQKTVAEAEKLNNLIIGRELKMIDLKKQLAASKPKPEAKK